MNYSRTIDGAACERAVVALKAAGYRYGFTAELRKVTGQFYVVIRGTNGPVAFDLSPETIAALTASGFRYPAWRASAQATSSTPFAVDYFMKHGRRWILLREDGSPILSEAQRTVLGERLDGRPPRLEWMLASEQNDVLRIADELNYQARRLD